MRKLLVKPQARVDLLEIWHFIAKERQIRWGKHWIAQSETYKECPGWDTPVPMLRLRDTDFGEFTLT